MNRLFCLLAFVYCLLTVSCGEAEKQVAIPKNILPKDKMTQVLVDVHLAEAEASFRTLPDSTSKEPVNLQKTFSKNSITKQQFDESMTFYIDHPELLDSVYVQVLNELSKMQGNQDQ